MFELVLGAMLAPEMKDANAVGIGVGSLAWFVVMLGLWTNGVPGSISVILGLLAAIMAGVAGRMWWLGRTSAPSV